MSFIEVFTFLEQSQQTFWVMFICITVFSQSSKSQNDIKISLWTEYICLLRVEMPQKQFTAFILQLI